MKRTYQYRGFAVSVEVQSIVRPTAKVAVLAPQGFAAIVRVSAAYAGDPVAAPTRIEAGNRQPFQNEAAALMAGFSAGQRIVDNLLSPR